MKRFPAALALLLAAFSAASAQEFSDMDGLASRLKGIQAESGRLASRSQAPHDHAMGLSTPFSAETELSTAAPDVSAYPVRGMDVSHYNGVIDWGKAGTAGLSFVYMKATEGSEYADTQFEANWKGAAAAGLARGAYHFYDFCRTGAEQAAQFIKTVPPDDDALPMTLDIEQSDDCKSLPGRAAFRKDLADFVARIEDAYGKLPVMYVNYSIYNDYFKGARDPYRFWIADVSHAAPSLPRWTLWQYGWRGSIPGLEGDVDLDAFVGTPDQLAELTRSSLLLSRR